MQLYIRSTKHWMNNIYLPVTGLRWLDVECCGSRKNKPQHWCMCWNSI